MKKSIIVTTCFSFSLLLAGCGDDASGDGGESGAGGDSGASGFAGTFGIPDGGDVVADGPWECTENHTAILKATGQTEECGLLRCKPESGCFSSEGCKSDDDCVESTAEAGWAVDHPVYCNASHLCDW